MNNRKIIFLHFLLSAALLGLLDAKCVNSTWFKYDLKEPSQLVNYNSLCSDFSKRTCCSNTNFQTLTKKIVKIIGGNVQLSNSCRYRLTSALCSWCDGDIGQSLKQGTCIGYCQQFYQDCKDDYFSFDTNNQLKVCKQQDIVCSKLSDILADKAAQNICQLLDLSVARYNCWNGQVSAFLKGKGKNKVTIPFKNQRKKSKQVKEPSIWQILVQHKFIFGPLLLGTVIMFFFTIKRGIRIYSLWKRQIRNL